MLLKGAVLCIITLIPISAGLYTYPKCPERCFCQNYNFTDCKYNGFTTLPSTGLDQNVTSLDLSFNEFQEFPEALNSFPSLVYLNISHNKIQSLGIGALRKLKNLEYLDFTYNKFKDWMDIRSNAFVGAIKLIFLDFSHNPLRSFPQDKNPLQISSLEILRLNNCSIESLNSNILEKLPNLKELHLSNNPIKELKSNFVSSNLKFLDLRKCKLHEVGRTVFTSLTSLQTLNMQQNYNLKRFHCNSPSLRSLDLSECNLEAVPSGSFPKLLEANFHGNHFRKIPKKSFEKFSDLKQLDLSYNTISFIEVDAFTGLNKIERIDLSQNTLPDIDPNMFEFNENLKFLNLSRNYLSKVLNLVSVSLEILDLSSCEIQSIDATSLMDMPTLKILNLSKNIISFLPDSLRADNLISLDVSLCRIKSVNNKTFSSMTSLRQINLSGNRLTSASPKCFEQVVYLDISDNTWRCDCANLKELYIWLSKTGKRVDNLYCQSPEMYEGYSWFSACQKEWYPTVTDTSSMWWYTTGLIVTVFIILFAILAMRRMYLLKEKRIRQANETRRQEERETLRRMQRMQTEAREEANRNAPDPRELQTPPSYNEALLLPRLDASHPSLSGSLHSLASKHSLGGSYPDVSNKRNRPRRKRRRRKSDSSEGQRASRVVVDSDTSEQDRPQPRTTLESDF